LRKLLRVIIAANHIHGRECDSRAGIYIFRMYVIMPPMPYKIKHDFSTIIFDMDGVITNTMPYHFDAWLEIFSRIGIKVNCFDVYKREGQDGLTSVKEILRERKLKCTDAQAKDILSRKERLFKHIVKIKFVKGSRPFIRMLKKRRFLLGLVTGTSRQEMNKILPLSLRSLFDAIVTGDDSIKGKPHPEPFLRALKILGIRPQEALVVENAPFGIEAAKRAGLFCAALETSLPRKYLVGADAVFKSFVALKSAIDFRLNQIKLRGIMIPAQEAARNG